MLAVYAHVDKGHVSSKISGQFRWNFVESLGITSKAAGVRLSSIKKKQNDFEGDIGIGESKL